MLRRRHFPYETLLRVRMRQEELKAQALAEIRREIRNTERRREIMQTQRTDALREAGGHARERFAPEAVLRYYQYERHLMRQIDVQDAALQELRTIEESRRADLEEAMKQRRTVERLKERHIESMRSQVAREEQGLSDEIASSRAARARATEG